MKDRLKKVLGAEVNKKLLGIGAVLLLMALAVPIIRIMMYCVPWYDDFSYGRMTKSFWEIRNSFWDALQGAFLNAKGMWYAWQGTYTSCFFMALMPAIWGTDKYVYGLWCILLILIIAVFCLVKVLLRDMLKSRDGWQHLVVQSLVAITVVLFMRSAIEGFFWYNSAVHYTAMHALGMLFIAGLIRLVYEAGRIRVILSILGFGVLFRNKNVLRVLPAGVCYGVAMYLNMGAPGNAKRMVHYEGMKLSPAEAILRSFQEAFAYLDDFTGWMTLAIVIAAIPVIWQIVSKVQFRFRYPGLVLLWSICLYAAGFTPTLYTMGHTLLGRATNMVKVTFQLLLFINLVYFIGWLYQYLKEKRSRSVTLKNSWCFYLLMGLIMIGIFAAEPNKGGIYSSYCAYYFVHTGEANNYYNEYLERVAICESDAADVVVRPYVFKPWVLCLGDLSEDPAYEPNKFMAEFFGKNSIVCIAPENEEQLQEAE